MPRVDKNFIQTQGKCKAFHTGSNSLCRQHIWQYYEIYKARCTEKDMVEHHWSIPRDIWREMEESKTEKKKIIQCILEFEKVQGVREFLCEVVVDQVAHLTAVDDQ
ncbi:hypothetical protein H0H87_008468, partial [Tephrocybe sp. NHM501043]